MDLGFSDESLVFNYWSLGLNNGFFFFFGWMKKGIFSAGLSTLHHVTTMSNTTYTIWALLGNYSNHFSLNIGIRTPTIKPHSVWWLNNWFWIYIIKLVNMRQCLISLTKITSTASNLYPNKSIKFRSYDVCLIIIYFW